MVASGDTGYNAPGRQLFRKAEEFRESDRPSQINPGYGYGRIAGLQPVWPTDEVGVPLARVGSHAAPVPPLLGSRRFSAAARADAARGQSPGASRHRPGARYSARLQQLGVPIGQG